MALGGSNSDLDAYTQRLDNLHEQKQEVADDITELWKEIKGAGHDTAALRRAYSIRKLGKEKRQALGTYVENLRLFD